MALRQRSHAGLNKGEASNALRDRTFENQSFRASGLSLITAAIVHWNTVYLDRAVRQLRSDGSQRSAGPCRPARMGAHRSDRRLHLDRGKPGRAISAAARGSFYVPAPGGLACSFEQIVW